jgi:hypothetical protein
MQECILDQMPQFVQFRVVKSLRGSVFLGGITAFMPRLGPEAASFSAICHGTLRDNDSERHTMRIHGQMYLGVEPPFVGSA